MKKEQFDIKLEAEKTSCYSKVAHGSNVRQSVWRDDDDDDDWNNTNPNYLPAMWWTEYEFYIKFYYILKNTSNSKCI